VYNNGDNTFSLHDIGRMHRAHRDALLARLPSDSRSKLPYAQNMGGRAVDPSLRDPWQRYLQIGTLIASGLLVVSMVTVAPRYQQQISPDMQEKIVQMVCNCTNVVVSSIFTGACAYSLTFVGCLSLHR
jgi:hypothetical protein